MSRPRQLSGEWYTTDPTPLGMKIAKGLEEQGEIFLTVQELLDGFGLAYTGTQTHVAIDKLLSFTKYLQAHQAHARDIGLMELDRSKLLYAFTYTVESHQYENQSLWVKEAFELPVPLLFLVHKLAEFWSHAYDRRPQDDIRAVLEGR